MSTTKQKNGKGNQQVLNDVLGQSSQEEENKPDLMKGDLVDHEIRETSDYSLFSYHKTNRDIKQGHVENLKDNIQEVGFLNSKHIMVDENGVVLDGQHRLEAAKDLGIKILYSVYDGEYTQRLVVLLNMDQQSWTLADFVKGFAEKGIEAYNKYWEFKEKYNFPTGLPAAIVGTRNAIVKRGDLEWPEDDEWVHTVGNVSSTIRDSTGEKYAQGKSFVRALKKVLFGYSQVVPLELARKISDAINEDRMHRSRKVGEFKMDMIRAWNYNRPKSSSKYIRNVEL